MPVGVRPSVARPSRRPGSHAWFVAALALLAGLVAAPSASAAIAKGLMDENLPRSDDPALRAEFYAEARKAKVTFARTFIQWDGTVDFPFPHEVESIRRMAVEGAANGIHTLYVGFNGELGSTYTDARQIDLVRYRTLVRRSAEALRGLPVRLVWSPLNEPNYQTQLPKKNGPEVWVKMQNIAYDEIKAVDPDALVVAGEMAPYARNKRKSTDPGLWWRRALGLTSKWKARRGSDDEGHTIKADAITLHAYDYKNNPAKRLRSEKQWTIRNLGTQRRLLRRAAKTGRLPRVATKRLYITEFGYLFRGSQRIGEARAATYLKRAWRIAKREKVRSFLWFQVRDPGAVFFSGLRDADGKDRKVLDTFRSLR
ncbi:MAG: hypothetical protein AB7G37_03295 [Solirubrobacteraceae bacterium]